MQKSHRKWWTPRDTAGTQKKKKKKKNKIPLSCTLHMDALPLSQHHGHWKKGKIDVQSHLTVD